MKASGFHAKKPFAMGDTLPDKKGWFVVFDKHVASLMRQHKL